MLWIGACCYVWWIVLKISTEKNLFSILLEIRKVIRLERFKSKQNGNEPILETTLTEHFAAIAPKPNQQMHDERRILDRWMIAPVVSCDRLSKGGR